MRIGRKGAEAVVAAAAELPRLTAIDLARNGIRKLRGCARLSHLSELVLHGNDFGAAGADELRDALPALPRLRLLYVATCGIPQAAGERLQQAWASGGRDPAGLQLHIGSAKDLRQLTQ